MEIYSGDLKLPGNSEFEKNFNKVSDLFHKWKETESDEDWNNYFEAKYRLEMGMNV